MSASICTEAHVSCGNSKDLDKVERKKHTAHCTHTLTDKASTQIHTLELNRIATQYENKNCGAVNEKCIVYACACVRKVLRLYAAAHAYDSNRTNVYLFRIHSMIW